MDVQAVNKVLDDQTQAPSSSSSFAESVKSSLQEKKESPEEEVYEKEEEKEEEDAPVEGLFTVVECDSPLNEVRKILHDLGVGSVGPGSVISSMGRDTNKTIFPMTRDLFDYLEEVDPHEMGTITRVEEYDMKKCIHPNESKGETYDIFCRLSNTRFTDPKTLTSSFTKNDVIQILEYLRDINILPAGSYFVDVPTPDRRVGTGGQVEFFFIRLNDAAHGETALALKAYMNGHLLPSSYTVVSTFWARGKPPGEKKEGKSAPRKKGMIVTPDEDDYGFKPVSGRGRKGKKGK